MEAISLDVVTVIPDGLWCSRHVMLLQRHYKQSQMEFRKIIQRRVKNYLLV